MIVNASAVVARASSAIPAGPREVRLGFPPGEAEMADRATDLPEDQQQDSTGDASRHGQVEQDTRGYRQPVRVDQQHRHETGDSDRQEKLANDLDVANALDAHDTAV